MDTSRPGAGDCPPASGGGLRPGGPPRLRGPRVHAGPVGRPLRAAVPPGRELRSDRRPHPGRDGAAGRRAGGACRDDPAARSRRLQGAGGAPHRPARPGPDPRGLAGPDRDARASRRQDHRRLARELRRGDPPGRERAQDRGAVRYGPPHPAGSGAAPQPGRSLDGAPDDALAGRGEPGGGRRRRDGPGPPEPGDRDRARTGSAPPARLRSEARDGALGRRRDAAAGRGDGAPDRPRAGRSAGRPDWPARRSRRSPRRAGPPSGSIASSGRSRRAGEFSTRSCTTRAGC